MTQADTTKKPKPRRGQPIVSATVDRQLQERVRAIARDYGMSVSDLVRVTLSAGVSAIEARELVDAVEMYQAAVSPTDHEEEEED